MSGIMETSAHSLSEDLSRYNRFFFMKRCLFIASSTVEIRFKKIISKKGIMNS